MDRDPEFAVSGAPGFLRDCFAISFAFVHVSCLQHPVPDSAEAERLLSILLRAKDGGRYEVHADMRGQFGCETDGLRVGKI